MKAPAAQLSAASSVDWTRLRLEAGSWKLEADSVFHRSLQPHQELPGGRHPADGVEGARSVLERGEMVAIVGASGVGKSTLLHVLGGLDSVDEGTVRIDETTLTTLSDAELVAFRNRHVGFVFQFHHLLPEFSALENAEMPMRIARRSASERRARASELLRRVSGSRRGSTIGRACCRAANSSASPSRARS